MSVAVQRQHMSGNPVDRFALAAQIDLRSHAARDTNRNETEEAESKKWQSEEEYVESVCGGSAHVTQLGRAACDFIPIPIRVHRGTGSSSIANYQKVQITCGDGEAEEQKRQSLHVGLQVYPDVILSKGMQVHPSHQQAICKQDCFLYANGETPSQTKLPRCYQVCLQFGLKVP
ncbi:hypothetical protein JZ751_009558, partial [Albula glossodonta]